MKLCGAYGSRMSSASANAISELSGFTINLHTSSTARFAAGHISSWVLAWLHLPFKGIADLSR
jgi:hypothetical protein